MCINTLDDAVKLHNEFSAKCSPSLFCSRCKCCCKCFADLANTVRASRVENKFTNTRHAITNMNVWLCPCRQPHWHILTGISLSLPLSLSLSIYIYIYYMYIYTYIYIYIYHPLQNQRIVSFGLICSFLGLCAQSLSENQGTNSEFVWIQRVERDGGTHAQLL